MCPVLKVLSMRWYRYSNKMRQKTEIQSWNSFETRMKSLTAFSKMAVKVDYEEHGCEWETGK